MYALFDKLLTLAMSEKSKKKKHNVQLPGSTHFTCTYLAHTLVNSVKSSTLACCTCFAWLHKVSKFPSRLGLENLSAHICKVRPLQKKPNERQNTPIYAYIHVYRSIKAQSSMPIVEKRCINIFKTCIYILIDVCMAEYGHIYPYMQL